MKLKIGLGQMNIIGGSPMKNMEKMRDQISLAKKNCANLLIFPELTIPGYLIGDMWEDDAFVLDSYKFNKEIIEQSKKINIVWGNVLPDTRKSLFNKNRKSFGNDGRLRKYNAAFIYSNGKPAKRTFPLSTFNNKKIFPTEGVTIKTNEPLYREFEDQRHFLSLKEYAQQLGRPLEDLLSPFEIDIGHKKIKIGVVICEDIWVEDYIYNGQPINPAKILVQKGAEILVVISMSPFGWRKMIAREKKINFLQQSLSSQSVPIIYLNAVGAQNNGKNEYVFDGYSTTYGASGQIIYRAPEWQEGVFFVEIETEQKTKFRPRKIITPKKREERQELLSALHVGLSEFAKQKSVENFVVGLSGGIDSTLVAYLCVQAVGKDHVLGINMPTNFNSQWTQSLARTVAKRLGIAYQVVPIQSLVEKTRNNLKTVTFNGDFGNFGPNKTDGVVDENIQARIRSSDVLSGVASKYPHTIYTCNGNKTETLLGWFTLDGDGRGAICPLGDVYKTDIANLATEINEESIKQQQSTIIPWELIAPIFVPENYYENWDGTTLPFPKNIRHLVPSAELSEKQNVNKGQGDPIIFDYHDPLLRQFVEYRQNPEDILRSYLDHGIIGLANKLSISQTRLERIIKTHFPNKIDWTTDLEKIWKLYNQAVYKQIQSPPIISVSKRSLGFDFRRSQSQAYFTKKYFELRETFLR